MPSRTKPSTTDLAQVRISPEAYACLHSLLGTLERQIRERAARQAQARDLGKGPGRIDPHDILQSAAALLPAVVSDLERALKQETSNVRQARRAC
jgi:hypothetical protein